MRGSRCGEIEVQAPTGLARAAPPRGHPARAARRQALVSISPSAITIVTQPLGTEGTTGASPVLKVHRAHAIGGDEISGL